MKNEMDGACTTHGEEEKCVQSFGGRLEGKRLLESSRRRWEDNIKIDPQEAGFRGVD
jgi:hypothetical protein